MGGQLAAVGALIGFFGTTTGLAWGTDPVTPPLVQEVTAPLEFGKIALLGTGGSAIMSPDGQRTLTGQLEALGGNWQAAEIKIEGKPFGNFVIVTRRAILNGGGNVGTLELTKVDCDPPSFGRLDDQGNATAHCGGTLKIPGHARAGDYVGHVSLMVAVF